MVTGTLSPVQRTGPQGEGLATGLVQEPYQRCATAGQH